MTVLKDLRKTYKEISLIDIVVMYVSIVSVINILLLSFELFYPIWSLVLGVVICCLLLLLFKVKINFKKVKSLSLLLLPIVLIAIFLRLSPNLYLTGGQDPGTYVSLSKQYQENHGLYIKDELREELSNDGQRLYDRGNIFLGLKMIDEDTSTYIMPFYPVFPSWMATFGEIFGSDNRVYALTMFSILSIVGMYLFSYEISGKNKKVGLLASFLLAINPLHVYFSRVPLTEIVSLTFFLFSFYYLMRFYRNSKEGNKDLFSLIMSLLTINVLFYTRMTAIFYLPVIVLLCMLVYLFVKDRYLKKSMGVYTILWVLSFSISYLFYYFYIPDLFNLIIGNRLPNSTSVLSLIGGILGLFVLVSVIWKERFFKFVRTTLKWLSKNLHIFLLVIFVGLIGYQLYGYVKEIFIEGGFTLLSFESLSYLKQLSFLATLLYVTPLGFIILPISITYYRKKEDINLKVLFIFISIFLIYCWGILKLIPYHYYFVRYQLSELIPLCLVLISIFLIDISKRKVGKWVLVLFIVFSTLYMGFFSIIQLRDYEGADREVYEELDEIIGEDDLLLVPKNNLTSFNQVVLPMKYYYDMNVFPIYYLSNIESLAIREFKREHESTYILTALPDIEGRSIKLVKEIDFKHNYLVHCNREEDAYFEMEGHTEDIPFCKYIIIPNRYYNGTYKMYLYEWK